jgi:hypothetical protein
MFMALGVFMREHTDAWLYLHTDRIGLGGIELEPLALGTGLPMERVVWADAYSYAAGRIGQADLAALYSMSDVLLASSMGEGFGIPVIEAQACGVPVIVSDFSAQPELCESGWLVKGQPYWDEAQTSFLLDPFVHSTVKNLNVAYAARGDAGLRERAVTFAAQYDSDLVFTRYWLPFLAELEASLEPPVVVRPNRAQRRAKKARRAA